MSAWMKVNPFYPAGLPKKPACYVVKVRGEVVYVGSTSNLSLRFHNHRFDLCGGFTIIPWTDEHFSLVDRDVRVKAKISKRIGDWAMWEIRLIRRLKPKYNQLGVGRRG